MSRPAVVLVVSGSGKWCRSYPAGMDLRLMTKMTLAEFRALHQRKLVERPKLFEVLLSDTPATDQQIEILEKRIGAKLPDDFKSFLKELGGGYFGLVNIFSANEGGEFYLPDRREDSSRLIPKEYIAISDDYSGGWYVLKINNDALKDPVWYWSPDGGLVKTEYANIFEFLADCAYDPA